MWLSEDCATLQNQSFWHSYEANCLNTSFFFFKVSPLIKLFPSLTCRYSFCVGGLWIVVLKGTAHSQCLMLVSSSLGFFCVEKRSKNLLNLNFPCTQSASRTLLLVSVGKFFFLLSCSFINLWPMIQCHVAINSKCLILLKLFPNLDVGLTEIQLNNLFPNWIV